MNPDIRASIDAKLTHVNTYFEVPEEMASEINALRESMEALGTGCSDVADFETRFASSAEGQAYYALFTKLAPKSFGVTDNPMQMAKDAYAAYYAEQDKSELAKKTAEEVADYAAYEARETARTLKRQAMIESGTFDDYTRVSNKIDDAERVIGAVGKLFKKKK